MSWRRSSARKWRRFLNGVYVERPDGALSFRWVKAPTGAELIIANNLLQDIARYLKR